MAILVKDALKMAAQLLGISEGVELHLAGEENPPGARDTALLLTCFQTVENELALDYLPLLAEEEMLSSTGRVEYSTLLHPAVHILSVEDEWGEPKRYRRFPAYLKTGAGKLKITYTYAPSAKTIEGESEYKTEASLRLFAYGMAAEYSQIVGELQAASAWDKKYKDAVQAAYRALPCKRIRARRWT